jgi:hypothetical protein
MNGYLLLFVFEMDDFPVGLFSSREEMLAAVEARRDKITDGLTEKERECFCIDASAPLGFTAIEFVNGLPVSREVIAWVE